MNCHMPRINEGMQDAVRTHMIYSPTRADMIEAAHPNACNLCHLDQSIDWTLNHLKSWYGREYAEESIRRSYPNRTKPVGTEWLRHEFEPVRLVAADSIATRRAFWALPELVELLDDEFLLNRQFTQAGIEDMLGIRLEDYGYRFYMSRNERRQPLTRIREALIEKRSWENVPTSEDESVSN